MKPEKYVLKETAHIATGVFVLLVVMMTVYAILGKFSADVLLGGIYAGVIAVGNFFIMGLTLQSIADRAASENRTEDEIQQMTKQMKAKMQLSYNGRVIGMFVLVVVGIKVLGFNPLASVLPLIFPRITIAVMGLKNKARKKGSANE